MQLWLHLILLNYDLNKNFLLFLCCNHNHNKNLAQLKIAPLFFLLFLLKVLFFFLFQIDLNYYIFDIFPSSKMFLPVFLRSFSIFVVNYSTPPPLSQAEKRNFIYQFSLSVRFANRIARFMPQSPANDCFCMKKKV